MGGEAIAVLGFAWVALGLVILVSAVLARRSERALHIGCYAVTALWVVAGGAVNAAFLLTGSSYSGFADGAYIPFVHETQESLVVPHSNLFIGVLIAFEAVAGLLVLIPGAIRQVALVALIGFNVALVSFGWGFFLWSVPMTSVLLLLLRADRRLTSVSAPRREMMTAA